MKASLLEEYACAPIVQRTVREVTDELLDQNVVFLFPRAWSPDWVAPALTAELYRREFAIRSTSLAQDNPRADPFTLLGLLDTSGTSSPNDVSWGGRGEADRTLLEEILLQRRLPDVFLVRSTSPVSAEAVRCWIDFAGHWAQLLHKIGNPDLPRLCLLIELDVGESLSVQEDVAQTVRWWWGISSALDTRLICRNTQHSFEPTPEEQWRECLLPSLCSGDPKLVEHLWDRIFDGTRELHAALAEYASMRSHWLNLSTSEHLQKRIPTMAGPGTPPSSHFVLWSAGLLVWSVEYGAELHTAWLAFRNRSAAVSHRIWRGQTPLLLPLLDQLRLRICENMTKRYGSQWVIRWHLPVSELELREVKNNPLACQWGHLGFLFDKVWDLRQRHKELLNLIQICRQTRNDLAHHRPVQFERFRSLLKEVDVIDF